MSSLHGLLQSFSQMLPPGSTIFVLAAELPSGEPAVHAMAAEAPAGGTIMPSPLVKAPSGVMSPLMRVAALRAESGPDTPLKLREWARKIGVSHKELQRAVKAKALAHETKPDGRDNKAHTVTVGVMENYLRTVSAVEAGAEEPPTWWKEVRGSRAV